MVLHGTCKHQLVDVFATSDLNFTTEQTRRDPSDDVVFNHFTVQLNQTVDQCITGIRDTPVEGFVCHVEQFTRNLATGANLITAHRTTTDVAVIIHPP
ncbi:hypothetical protein D3C86_1577590 [compost metagenome]